MTTELVILLTLFAIVIAGVFRTPAETFQNAGPKLGMRIEKQIETGVGFTSSTRGTPNPVQWGK